MAEGYTSNDENAQNEQDVVKRQQAPVAEHKLVDQKEAKQEAKQVQDDSSKLEAKQVQDDSKKEFENSAAYNIMYDIYQLYENTGKYLNNLMGKE